MLQVIGGLIAGAALLVALGRPDVTIVAPAAASTPLMVNYGRSCLNVVDFGADPSGVSDSTQAFRNAFGTATTTNGVAVCAPAGTFLLSGDITLYSASTNSPPHNNLNAGMSFFGAGPGLTILQSSASTANVFDSCPSFSNVSPPEFVHPTPCPTVSPVGNSPNSNTRLNGMVFANFSIVHSATTTGSDFYFPEIHSLLVDNVCVSGSRNVFDLGDQINPPSWGPVTIRDSTCGYQFSGHFLAAHGGGGSLNVANNTLNANGTGIAFDTTDMTDPSSTTASSGSAGNMVWSNNLIEQPFVGMYLFVGGPGSSGPGIQDSQWRENEYDGCVLACYYFGVDAGLNPRPDFGHITVSDRRAASLYDAIYLNGGFYDETGGGVRGIQVGGPSSYSGASGTASSLLMLRGSPSPGDQVWVVWSGTAYSTYMAPTTATDVTTQSMAQGLTAAITGAPPSPVAAQINLANPNYALIGLSLPATPAPGSYNLDPYTLIINSASLEPVGLPAPHLCSPPGSTLSYSCYNGFFDNGDGVGLRNNTHDIDIIGARVTSLAGAAIHLWPDGGDIFHFLSNVLGNDGGVLSYTAIQLDAPVSSPPVDYYLGGNDLVGAQNGIVDSVTGSTFLGSGLNAAMRAHRGATGFVTPLSTTPSMATSISVPNAGPIDCTYYFSWGSTVLTMLTLAYATSSSASASLSTSPPPSQITIPVGAVLSATISPSAATASYQGFCQP